MCDKKQIVLVSTGTFQDYIKENINHKCDVRFSALWWNNECDFEPHYYTRDIAKDTDNVWIFFPHENWWEEGLIS